MSLQGSYFGIVSEVYDELKLFNSFFVDSFFSLLPFAVIFVITYLS